MQKLSNKLNDFKNSIFDVMSAKAREVGAINLGQGFPDFQAEQWLLDLGADAMSQGYQQYAPYLGMPELREQISKNYKNFYDLNYSDSNEIIVTNGATEGIFSSILALVSPGDEVIVLEPFYDSYISSIKLAGGIPIPITLYGNDFSFNNEELSKAFSSKTKLLILNNPHNPSGKVFSLAELQKISQLVLKNDAYVLSDEVYEFLTFDEHKHIPMASLPQMQERTITLSSVGKTFGVTGWKIGWACSSPELIKGISLVHQYNTFSVNTPCQRAAALALGKLDEYLPEFKKLYENKRNKFCAKLEKLGWKPIKPNGTYFVFCPIDHLTDKNDVDFCMELIEKYNIAAIPPSAFYLKSDEGKRYIRFCFAKKDETLDAALEKISNYPFPQ